ncbi:hypothetical protein [Psychrobacter aestuarii]|uniref:Lipoprotein n=1 Tax=Psychrobacter aestuarii TaxID=556327 RepID=A0ABN0VRQ3_9GAMM|nr:hypothetical protein [Psychrobacter aestuarii]
MNTSFFALWSSAPYRVGAMLVAGSLVITGCQTTRSMQPSQTTAIPAQAKDRVNAALKAQYRKSMSYHSNIEFNNRAKFTAIDPKTISTVSSVYSYCEETHDAAYIKLLKQAEAAGLEIDDARYDTPRQSLEQTYVACERNYSAWQQNQYDDYAADEKQAVSPYYQDLFDRMEAREDMLSKEEIESAKATYEQWYKPLSVNVQGVYQPLAGKLTVLPSAQYDTRNHHTSISQPLYLDAKSGNLYLWADNVAILNSKFMDKKLGTQWQNKWLKLSLNDGSLPKGFGRTLIKSHLSVSERMNARADSASFKTLPTTALAALTPKIPAHQLSVMQHSDYVIAQTQSVDAYRQTGKEMSALLFNELKAAYPELVAEALAEADSYDYDDEGAVAEAIAFDDSESAMATLEATADAEAEGSDSDDEAYRAYDADAERDAYNDDDSDYTEKTAATYIAEKLDGAYLAKALIRMLDGSRNVELPTADSSLKVQKLYGFDKQGNLLWMHMQSPAGAFVDKALDSTSTIADILTTYSRIDRSQKDFPNLPTGAQTPNAQNSVDIKAYLEALDEDKDNAQTLEGMRMRLFSMMMMASAMTR